MSPGSWRPARLTSVDVVALTGGLIVAAGVRSGDYATGDDATSPLMSVIETAAPMWLWALVVGAGGVLLAAGMLTRRHALVWVGYGTLWIVYLALMIGVLLGALNLAHLDGLRGAGPLLVMAELHFILWLRTGVRPLPRDGNGTHVEEVVTGDGEPRR